MNSFAAMTTNALRLLCLVVAASLLPAALAAPPRKARPEPVERPSESQMRRLQDDAAKQAAKRLQAIAKEAAKVKKKKGPSKQEAAAELKRLAALASFYRGFIDKIAARREIEALQAKCVKEELTGPEPIKQLEELSAKYTAAGDAMKRAGKYYQDTRNHVLLDPVTELLRRQQEAKEDKPKKR